MATGVGFGNVDCDWLFDCLEVGSVTIDLDDPNEAQCLCLGPKGIPVAEEYLEARFRLYRMVYMHKTTRAAEKMLVTLLRAVATAEGNVSTNLDPVLSHLRNPTIGSYLDLDDAVIWSALLHYKNHTNTYIADLAGRLRNRDLYKCVDIGAIDEPDGNLYIRVRHKLSDFEWYKDLVFDAPSVTPYKWYNFEDASALNKVLVKKKGANEPRDIASVSRIVQTLKDEERIQRVYAPDSDRAAEIVKVVEELHGR